MEKHIVAIGWDNGQVKLCLVQYHPKGLFVHFPYHPDMQGLLSRATVPAGPGEVKVDLKASGAVTSHKVKYSHHTDGNALFSQDGKVLSKVRGRAADLRTPAGHIFSIDVQGLHQLAKFDTSGNEYYGDRYGRCYFEFQSAEPTAVHIVGRWMQLREGRRIEELRNPVGLTEGGRTVEGIAIAPPSGSPLEGGFLIVEVVSQSPLSDAEFQLLFSGCFEKGMDDPEVESACLLMQYPATDVDDLPNIDFVRD
jgi:hypothetical protein